MNSANPQICYLLKVPVCAEDVDSVTNWVLSVELDGEWEECRFATRREALATFVALAKDYSHSLKSAILVLNPLETGRDLPREYTNSHSQWVN